MNSTLARTLSAAALVSSFALGAFVLGGCSLLPGPLGNLNARAGENPLKGQPLAWSDKPASVPFEGERACTTWPIQDELTVTATNEQICVKGKTYKLLGNAFGSPGKRSFSAQSDGSGESGLLAGMTTSIESSEPHKVGHCTSNNQGLEVWEQVIDSCVPNKDTSGKPALTMSSTFLQVGDARWKFRVPEGTTATTSAPAAPAAKASGK
ncbi:hypothetical protein AKJ09_06246 [Labilithrix luteola]|uniref:Lipoprotein n=1 Tax=Labilithrix luteola TaxID=1391654 RepID=A0A0K1Q1G8_9BACT|nr:hypothetical protein [Labilithrix luteola]AKU99582.1 hypothetical protein AKJ09_06246 [Labilithrix luteola]